MSRLTKWMGSVLEDVGHFARGHKKVPTARGNKHYKSFIPGLKTIFPYEYKRTTDQLTNESEIDVESGINFGRLWNKHTHEVNIRDDKTGKKQLTSKVYDESRFFGYVEKGEQIDPSTHDTSYKKNILFGLYRHENNHEEPSVGTGTHLESNQFFWQKAKVKNSQTQSYLLNSPEKFKNAAAFLADMSREMTDQLSEADEAHKHWETKRKYASSGAFIGAALSYFSTGAALTLSGAMIPLIVAGAVIAGYGFARNLTHNKLKKNIKAEINKIGNPKAPDSILGQMDSAQTQGTNYTIKHSQVQGMLENTKERGSPYQKLNFARKENKAWQKAEGPMEMAIGIGLPLVLGWPSPNLAAWGKNIGGLLVMAGGVIMGGRDMKHSWDDKGRRERREDALGQWQESIKEVVSNNGFSSPITKIRATPP